MMFVKAARTSALKPGEGKVITANGIQIALFNVGGAFYALDNTCSHRGGPLGDGMLSKNVVTCPWHGWQYDITTGQCLTTAGIILKRFPTKVEGDDVLVDV